jgi:hypothetical protein
MRIRKLREATSVVIALMGLMFLTATSSSAQKLAKSITIQGTAMGQSTQLGQVYDVTLIIEEFSPPEDQKALVSAFAEKGNEGLINALDKMKSKGRMAITGTLGYDVSYIRQWKQADGTVKLRLVTNRPIRFGEAWTDSRSADYELSGVDIILSPNKKKNEGTLLPRAQLKMNKENQLEVEVFQNPWKLENIQQRSGAPLL